MLWVPATKFCGLGPTTLALEAKSSGWEAKVLSISPTTLASQSQNFGLAMLSVGGQTQNVGGQTQTVGGQTQNVGGQTQNVEGQTQNVGELCLKIAFRRPNEYLSPQGRG